MRLPFIPPWGGGLSSLFGLIGRIGFCTCAGSLFKGTVHKKIKFSKKMQHSLGIPKKRSHVNFRPILGVFLISIYIFLVKVVGKVISTYNFLGKIEFEIEKTFYIWRNFTWNLYIKYLKNMWNYNCENMIVFLNSPFNEGGALIVPSELIGSRLPKRYATTR